MDIYEISKQINSNAHDKGFWDEGIDKPKKLLLAVSELCEAMEADRKNNYVEKRITVSEISNENNDEQFLIWFNNLIKDTFEDELADAAIRIFDLAYEMKIDLPTHIAAKHRYNCSRPKMHNKKY